MADGSNESLYHANEKMHPLVRNFSPSQTMFKNLDVEESPNYMQKSSGQPIYQESSLPLLMHLKEVLFYGLGFYWPER